MRNLIDNPKSCWLLIPVHNRCELTRNCLSRLKEIGVLEKYTVCVIDDASTDGTREMLEKEFPVVVRVEGNGDLFWGGGIALGMNYARDQQAEIYFWLNDDCVPDRGSIDLLIERVVSTRGICGGACYEEDGVTLAYSGSVMKGGEMIRVSADENEIVSVELLNGNMVAIHHHVVDEIGIVDKNRFPHYGGDSIYALEANRAGFKVEVHGGATGINPRGNYFIRFGARKPASDLWKDVFWKGSPNYLPAYWYGIKAIFAWHAYYRWPAYFLRLAKLYLEARKRSPISKNT